MIWGDTMDGGRHHLRAPEPLSPATRLRAALDRLHWSGRGLAAILRLDERKVRRWASGDYEPPDQLLVWLETLAAFHDKNPPPARD